MNPGQYLGVQGHGSDLVCATLSGRSRQEVTGYRGARLILDVGQAPLAGATHAFTQTPACSTSVAITPMRVCTTPAAVFLAIALESPDLARLVLRDLADQLSQTVSAAVELASLSPGARDSPRGGSASVSGDLANQSSPDGCAAPGPVSAPSGPAPNAPAQPACGEVRAASLAERR